MSDFTSTQLTEMILAQTMSLQTLINSSQKKMPKTILKGVTPNISIEQFIDNIEIIEISKLLNCKLPRYYALTIMHNLEKIDSKNHPIICTDSKLKKFYCYSSGEWSINKQFIKSIKSKIFGLIIDLLVCMKQKIKDSDETQMFMSLFFDVETYPSDKLYDKICVELGVLMPSIQDIEFDGI